MKNRKAFIVGIKSDKLSSSEKIFLKKYKPWGIILFSRNIKNLKQVKKLVQDIKTIFKDKKYPILVDQEGGRVNRLYNLIETSCFTGEFFGNLYKNDKKSFFLYYTIYINQLSYLLNEIGININTVPVLDVRHQNASNVIGDRSFSSDKKVISKIGNFCISEFAKQRIGTVIKHIPGHGLSNVDSHKLTPKVKNDYNFLLKNDFYTFKNKKSFFAMTAHVIYQDIDSKNVATHLKKIIALIRNKINFNGIIISDDISMKALKTSIKVSTIKSFDAGCNLILHCNANMKEMITVADNTPIIDKFIIKKTSQFYNFLS